MTPVPRLHPRRLRPRRRADERGAVAILVSLSMTFLVVATAMVLDFGLVRLDRQQLRNVADDAAMAGIAAGDAATGDVYSHRAVCGALASLRTSREFTPSGSFTGLPDGICSTATLASNLNVKCEPGVTATYATYAQTVTRGEVTYRVRIEAPYDPTSGDWSAEDLARVTADQSTVGGCDQVGVQIWKSREPGLGSIATSSDLEVGVRSAARALLGTEDDMAPSLILLERRDCRSVVADGSSKIHVHGIRSTPGSIHVDSDATGPNCSSASGQQLFFGQQPDAIVAYGSIAPTGTSGAVTAFAGTAGVAANILSNSVDRVYGTPSTTGTGTPKNPVTGRDRVGRRPVDLRYRTAVRTAIGNEHTSNVWNLTAASAASAGWTSTAGCSVTDAQASFSGRLYVNCAGGAININKTLQASEIFLDGYVANARLSMPNATKVYVKSANPTTAEALRLESDASSFCVRITCGATPAACPTTTTTNRARIFVRTGSIVASGGQLRMCNSTVFMLSGDTATGCVPGADNALPTSTPCASGTSAGTGTIAVGGNTVFDWTAPNQYADSVPLADRESAWANFEDLATWSETAGTYEFSGSGGMVNMGVFMVPNAKPVLMRGSSNQTITNAQYVARTFSATGSATMRLTTDPRNAVTIPAIRGYVLVR